MNQTCATCRFAHVEALSGMPMNALACRRHPPQALGSGANAVFTFPWVNAKAWCGEHEPKAQVPQ